MKTYALSAHAEVVMTERLIKRASGWIGYWRTPNWLRRIEMILRLLMRWGKFLSTVGVC